VVDEIWTARAERPADVPLLHTALAAEIERLRGEPGWETSDRNAITLAKQGPLRVVLVVFKPGARLQEHRASGPVTVQVVSGHVTLTAAERVVQLVTGDLVTLQPALPHAVEAVDESALLLTIVQV
jgi:quercetin dioxygenase-like cupin family protein